MVFDVASFWELIRVPATVLVTDTVMWLNWAWKNRTISSYEWSILVDRLIKFGSAGVLIVMLGQSWEVAGAAAGLLTFGDAWIKSLQKDNAETVEEVKAEGPEITTT